MGALESCATVECACSGFACSGTDTRAIFVEAVCDDTLLNALAVTFALTALLFNTCVGAVCCFEFF